MVSESSYRSCLLLAKRSIPPADGREGGGQSAILYLVCIGLNPCLLKRVGEVRGGGRGGEGEGKGGE